MTIVQWLVARTQKACFALIVLGIGFGLITPVSTIAQTSVLPSDTANSAGTSPASATNQQDGYPAQNASAQTGYPAQTGTQPAAQGQLGVNAGPTRIGIYGNVLLNLSANDNPVVGGEIPLWASPSSGNATFPDGSVGRVHDLFFTARQTIFGVTVSPSSPPANGWAPGATVEFDFFGPRPTDTNIPQGRVLGAPRLRLAYFQLSKGTWKLVAGQDKMIVAPLDPISLSHVAVPLGATAGNLWGWLPQARLEKTHNFASKTSALFQVGVLRPEFSDSRLGDNLTATPTSLDNSTAGTRSIMPFYQARVAVSHPMSGSTATVGAGVHYGREKVGVNHDVDSWAFALDFRVPVQTRLILRGEAYAGSNLIPFEGGIDQGVSAIPTAQPFTRINKIGDGGGWGELTIRATTDDKNHVYLGAGTDDPKDANLLPGSTKSKNTFYWASYFHRFTSNLTIAWEWSNWQFRTRQPTATSAGPKGTYGRANVFNLALGYSF